MAVDNTRATPAASPNRPRTVLLYWGRRGGGSDVTLFLAQHLGGAAGPVDVALSLSRRNSDMAAFTATGLPIVTFDRPHLATLWQDAWLLPGRLRRHVEALASLRPSAVIVTMNAPFAWPFTRLLQRRGIRVYYVAHDAEPHPGDYAATWQRVTQDLLIKGADRVVALSNGVAERIVNRLPSSRSKVTVIPLETIYPTHRPRLARTGSLPGPVRLLFYGRLLPYKGLDLLARALEPLRQRENWQLTLAGSGPLEAEVGRAFADWPQVELRLGWISHEETAELFSTHDLLLCPYVEASQSGVVAQALSWGMPSLVMPTGALPEQIGFGEAGLIASPADAAGFSQTLALVLERPNLLTGLSERAGRLLSLRQSEDGWVRLFENAS